MSSSKKSVHKTADIAIVLPVYNRARIVKRTIRSIEGQKVWPSELIMVDNASTDNTRQVLNDLAAELTDKGMNIKVVTEEERGAAAARNRGLAEVTAKWVMFFDSDDEMMTTHLKSAMACAERHPDAEIIGWDVEGINLDGTCRRELFNVSRAKRRNLYNGSMATQRFMAHTELVRRVGGWNKKMLIWDDIELGSRLIAQRPKMVKRHDEILVLRHAQRESITGTTFAEREPLYKAPLDALLENLGERWKNPIALKAMILAADMTREGSDHGIRWRHYILDAISGTRTRAILKAAYAYQVHGGRGTARIFHSLLPR